MAPERLERIRALLDRAGAPAAVITSPENRRYLSGFTGSAGVLVVGYDRAYLLVDPRYTEQARQEARNFSVVEVQESWVESLAALVTDHGWSVLGYEDEHLSCRQFKNLQDKLGSVRFVPLSDVDALRLVKTEAEIALIRQGVRLVDTAFDFVLGRVLPGRREQDVALDIEIFLRRNGAERTAFPTIVASGPRSALPHGVASDRIIGYNELVIIDCGAVCGGYCSDFTRTVVTTEPLPWQEEIYNVVLEAQQAAIATIRAGVEAHVVDAAARQVIETHGYGAYFGHGTGHGLGLAVHEAPRLGKKETLELRAGMVVTVEPGIYLPERGGVRIEDVVVVREDGCEVLTRAPKNRLLCVG